MDGGVERPPYHGIPRRLLDKSQYALCLQEVVRIDRRQQWVSANAKDRGQQVAQCLRVPGSHELNPKDLVDRGRRRVGADPAVPSPQLLKRCGLQAASRY